ncbi:hypothetical protein IE53DRAFT_118322 [Violaceomyces palustris]|uniref:Uncharacterized protein n=1 Tax=Violaceomyces palustris TaxID=1673888 RepID=A0ACD0NW68_9BASI|nr:hypothetical protein IE53DRAFT_118322 [Violaceomyces palustris]
MMIPSRLLHPTPSHSFLQQPVGKLKEPNMRQSSGFASPSSSFHFRLSLFFQLLSLLSSLLSASKPHGFVQHLSFPSFSPILFSFAPQTPLIPKLILFLSVAPQKINQSPSPPSLLLLAPPPFLALPHTLHASCRCIPVPQGWPHALFGVQMMEGRGRPNPLGPLGT